MKEAPTQLTDGPDEGLEATVRPGGRLLLWVDGVGGFLICLAPRVLLGHGSADNDADVPILADVSRRHAWLERDAQGYVIEAGRSVQLNQQTVKGKALIRHGDLITLGRSCQFTFTQAVPVSASARLDLVSGHRLWRALQGVLLMAETLVLGPGPAAHVQVADLPQPLVLFRRQSGLAVRYPGPLWLGGRPQTDRCAIEPGERVVAHDLSLTLERIGAP